MKFKQGSSILYKADISIKQKQILFVCLWMRKGPGRGRCGEGGGSVALFIVILQLKRGILDSLWYPIDIRLNLFFYILFIYESLENLI